MAGYSGTPLAKKLGVKPGAHVVALSVPNGFDSGPLRSDGELRTDLRSRADVDVALIFCRSGADLKRAFERVQPRLAPNGAIWIAWPKKASAVATELTGDVVRAHGLHRGLVDNKICAVDDTWSGLRFVIRTEDRARYAARRKEQRR